MSYFVKFCNKVLRNHHKLLHLVHYLWKDLNQPFSQCKCNKHLIFYILHKQKYMNISEIDLKLC